MSHRHQQHPSPASAWGERRRREREKREYAAGAAPPCTLSAASPFPSSLPCRPHAIRPFLTCRGGDGHGVPRTALCPAQDHAETPAPPLLLPRAQAVGGAQLSLTTPMPRSSPATLGAADLTSETASRAADLLLARGTCHT